MKKLLLIVVAVAIIVGCGSDTQKFTINGNIKNLPDGIVYLADVTGVDMIDSVMSKGGVFKFEYSAESPSAYFMLGGGRGAFALCFAENGQTINIKGDVDNLQNIVVEGSEENIKLRAQFTKAQEWAQMPMEEQVVAYSGYLKGAIAENRDNIYGVYALNDYMMFGDTDEIVDSYEKLSPKMKETKIGKEIQKAVNKMLNPTPTVSIGDEYYDFEAVALDGKDVPISNYFAEGKYVLLDFWASWCGPCMREIPHLKTAYEQFKDKGFEIVGVSLDREADAWKKAVADNEMSWAQVIFDPTKNEVNPTERYGIKTIPANFLIAPDGKVVASGLRGEKIVEILRKHIK